MAVPRLSSLARILLLGSLCPSLAVASPSGFLERTEEGIDSQATQSNPEPTAPDEVTKQEPGQGKQAPSTRDDSKRPFGYAKVVGAPQSDAEFTSSCDFICYAHLYATTKVGRGLRFNNPFRLQTQLGSTSESLSLTAPYTDVAIAALFGDPSGFQQGALLSFSVAMFGVPQQVLAPAYAVAQRWNEHWQLRGHIGVPFVLEPESNIGLDLSLGGAFMFLAGLGATGDLVFSLYEGAATDQSTATLIPIVSFQLGLTIDYEVLP